MPNRRAQTERSKLLPVKRILGDSTVGRLARAPVRLVNTAETSETTRQYRKVLTVFVTGAGHHVYI